MLILLSVTASSPGWVVVPFVLIGVETGLEVTSQDSPPKTKISLTLHKSAQFDSLYAAAMDAEANAAAAAL